jgi:probable F420-dependent oxidoreductase
MRIGLFAPLGNPFATPDYLKALGPACESRGFHSLWVAEHVVLFDDYGSRYPYAADGRIPAGGENGILEPFTTLAFLASNTERIRLGTGICLVPQRNPVYTAKEAANVDWVSGGRLDLGIGVGWLAEEFQALGVSFERRGARCRDYLDVMRSLWCDPVSEHHGEFYDLPACRQYPKPVQQPHPPLHFGGESDAALRRVANRGQGWYGYDLEPEAAKARVADLTRLLEARDRRRGDVLVSVCSYLREPTRELAERYREAGVDQLILFAVAGSLGALEARLDQLAEEIVEPARAL